MNLLKLLCIMSATSGMISFLPALHAQEWKLMTREEIEAKVHPTLLKDGNRLLRFDTSRLSVDTLNEEDAPRTVIFRFRNISRQTLTLTKVTTSCGCTGVVYSKQPLAPQEESKIALTFHPKNRPGTVDAEALVYTNLSACSPVAKLSLTGYVKDGDAWSHLPLRMGHLRLSRRQVEFDMNHPNEKQRIACANSGEQPLKLKAMLLPIGVTFHTEPKIIQPGQEGDLVISLEPGKITLPNTDEKTLSIILDGVNGKPSERTIKILIKR